MNIEELNLNAVAADYLQSLASKVSSGEITTSEALQRAHQHGTVQGRIEGLEIGKQVIGAPVR